MAREELDGAEEVTQYGTVWPDTRFKCRPEPSVEALSLIRGRASVEEAVTLVTRGRRWKRGGDAVRYTTVGILRVAGFDPYVDNPDKNPWHVRVESPGPWDDHVCQRWDGCFSDPTQGE
jgi:hypothetical protein